MLFGFEKINNEFYKIMCEPWEEGFANNFAKCYYSFSLTSLRLLLAIKDSIKRDERGIFRMCIENYRNGFMPTIEIPYSYADIENYIIRRKLHESFKRGFENSLEELKVQYVYRVKDKAGRKKEDVVSKFHPILNYKFNDETETLKLTVPPILVCLMSKDPSFLPYEIACKFGSIYSLRLALMQTKENEKIQLSVDRWKDILQIEGKYRLTKTFELNVFVAAKKELDLYAPYTFDYKTIFSYDKSNAPINGIELMWHKNENYNPSNINEQQTI